MKGSPYQVSYTTETSKSISRKTLKGTASYVLHNNCKLLIFFFFYTDEVLFRDVTLSKFHRTIILGPRYDIYHDIKRKTKTWKKQ